MEQYPGEGSPAEADSSPDGDGLSRLRRVGRWVRGAAIRRGNEAKRGHPMVIIVADPVATGLERARLDEEADEYPAADPVSGYPRPLTPGVTVYPDLSLGSPDFDHDDPDYEAALDMIRRLARDV